jgi:oligopeptide/dipeptide ABC transporter ATP-binding protein
VSDRIAVMYLGRIVEEGAAAAVHDDPQHPYTQALLSAIPHVRAGRHRERIPLHGDLPSATDPPAGCVFHTRCPHAMDVCRVVVPATLDVAGRRVACHLHDPALTHPPSNTKEHEHVE